MPVLHHSVKRVQVLLAIDTARQNLVAIKVVYLATVHPTMRASYLNEVRILEQLQGSNKVVRVFETSVSCSLRYITRDTPISKSFSQQLNDELYVVMEKGDVDLATFLRSRKQDVGNALTEMHIQAYWVEMLRCVKVIHDHG